MQRIKLLACLIALSSLPGCAHVATHGDVCLWSTKRQQLECPSAVRPLTDPALDGWVCMSLSDYLERTQCR